MHSGLPLKIALIFFLLTGSGVIGVTYISFINASALLEQQSLESLSNDLKRENTLLETSLNNIKEEALFLSQLPAVNGIIRAYRAEGYDDVENLSEASWQRRLGELFQIIMEQRAPYTQLRLIGLADHGRELVRVNRTESGIEIVEEINLQHKGDATYFQKSLHLNAGEVYYSRVNYNREHGKIAFPLQPVLRIGVPVFSTDGQVFGALVINVDFRKLASSLYQQHDHTRYYLANENGDYIIHPDKEKQLAFEMGESAMIQDEYPIDINQISSDPEVFDSFSIPELKIGIATHRLYFDSLNPARFFLISAVTSQEVIHTESLGLAQQLTYVAVIAILLISVLAAITSRLLTRRLITLREIADRVASGDENVEIKEMGRDEIGILALSFKEMLSRLTRSRAKLHDLTASLEHKVLERTQELERSNKELLEAKHLAEASTQQLQNTLEESEKLWHEAEYARKDAERYAEKAQQANIAKSDFLANMSHELRTPLNGIIGMTHFTLESQLTPEQRKQLNTIDFSAKTLLSLLNDILDVSKVEAGKLILENRTFNLHKLIDNTIDTHMINAREKGIKLISSITNDVPIYLSGDSERLRQVIVNMLGNAIKFTNKGEVELHVALKERQKNSISLHFSVRDTGIGIAKDKLATIFEPFTQADNSTTRQYGGTGLGTTISRQIVELMDGRIWVESELGKGSTFHFIVVLKASSEQDIEKNRDHNVHDTVSDTEIPPLNILVAEDNEVNQQVIQLALTRLGHQMTLAKNGRIALELWRKSRFDLILMDVQMPEMDGLTATKQIRSEESGNNHTPIIAVTANAMVSDRDQCLDAGMDDYITKPINIEQLQQTISRIITNSTTASDDKIKTEPVTTQELCDLEPLRTLTQGNDEQFKNLIQIFINNFETSFADLKLAIHKNSAEQVKFIAHKIKGSAGQLKATAMSELSFELEVMGRDSNLESAAKKLSDLENIYQEVKLILETEIEEACV